MRLRRQWFRSLARIRMACRLCCQARTRVQQKSALRKLDRAVQTFQHRTLTWAEHSVARRVLRRIARFYEFEAYHADWYEGIELVRQVAE